MPVSVLRLYRAIKRRLLRAQDDKEKSSKIAIDNRILLGTHHKTGTVWMASVFGSVSKKTGLNFYKGGKENLPERFDIWHEDHSRFGNYLSNDDYQGLHIIRDPRDVIVSACFYHQKSDEPLLHVPRDEFGGLTYQQKLCSLGNIDEQLLFEMKYSAGANIRDMVEWDYSNPNFMNIKYEDLLADTHLLLFHRIFSFLGFPAEALPVALRAAYDNSLFSGKVFSAHVQSGQTARWKRYFKPVHKERFHELFGDTLIKLGYEASSDWPLGY